MTKEELSKALVAYRVLEEQKQNLTDQQDELKAKIEKHMVETKVDSVESNDIVAQLVHRAKYSFDVPAILAADPKAIRYLKITNTDFLKVLKGNEDRVATARKVISDEKSLTIRSKDEAGITGPVKPLEEPPSPRRI